MINAVLKLLFRKNIFESKAAGATPDATKVLVLITDGDPSDSDSGRIIRTYDEKSIIRLVIGVRCCVSLYCCSGPRIIYQLEQ